MININDLSPILIIGTPNAGKSLLFNRLTGLNQKVANFPGITVDVFYGPSSIDSKIILMDFPGIYSLNPISEEEKLAVKKLKESLAHKSSSPLCFVIDATRIERSLYLASQILRECQRHQRSIYFLLNMVDVLEKNRLPIDINILEQELGTAVYPVSAKTGKGLELIPWQKTHTLNKDFSSFSDSQALVWARQLAIKAFPKQDVLINEQNSIDTFFLHSWLGLPLFILIMGIFFQAIYSWSGPLMDIVESLIAILGQWTTSHLEDGLLKAFLSDAVFGGFGAFLVFVPQIFVLTMVVGLMEDSGYLARATVLCHRPMRFFGLSGKSFVPMLSGVACAIPAIYAARSIDSPRRRWLTYFAIPLMPCSARLPVYSLLITAFIPNKKIFGGLMGLQGFAMMGLYFLGIFFGLIVAALMSKRQSIQKLSDTPFLIELPPYRLPSLKPLVNRSIRSTRSFITGAGPTIFAVTAVIWILGYFPNQNGILEQSYLASIGHFFSPFVDPLGLDWRFGVAILTSFLAREVFVGTLGTLFGIEAANDITDQSMLSLADQLTSQGVTLASGLSLLVFFAFALQCVSTFAVLKKESGSSKLPWQAFFIHGSLAYIGALITFRLVQSLQ